MYIYIYKYQIFNCLLGCWLLFHKIINHLVVVYHGKLLFRVYID